MSCDAFEKLIALDAGATSLRRIGAARCALSTCAPCRELAQSLRESQAALKGLSQDALDERVVAAWRRGLLARTDAAEPRRAALGWPWAWAAAAAMALVALLAVPGPRGGRLFHHLWGRRFRLPWQARPAPPPQPPAPVVHRRTRHRRAPTPAPGPLMVKLETPDPNVVIYWMVDRKGN